MCDKIFLIYQVYHLAGSSNYSKKILVFDINLDWKYTCERIIAKNFGGLQYIVYKVDGYSENILRRVIPKYARAYL